MRIAVIGAGSLGCLFGARLAANEHDVWLLHHRPEYVKQLLEHGVRIQSDYHSNTLEVDVPATTTAGDIGPVDLVLVLVKAHHTKTAVRDHAACIGPETHVLSLQNGLRNYEYLIDLVGAERALGGVTYQAAITDSPGEIQHTSQGETIFGGQDHAFAERVRMVFEQAGFETTVAEDPRHPIWDKQLLGLATLPLAALTRLMVDNLMNDDGLEWIMHQLIAEARAVAEAHDIDLRTDDVLTSFQEMVGTYPSHKISMLQDIEYERKTEIDELNGAIVDLATEADVDVPINRTVTELVRSLEQSYLNQNS